MQCDQAQTADFCSGASFQQTNRARSGCAGFVLQGTTVFQVLWFLQSEEG